MIFRAAVITPTTLLKYKTAQPFRPFRVHLASGKTFDIRHPQVFQVTKDYLLIFSFTDDQLEIFDDYDTILLKFIEHISDLEVPAA